MGGGSETLLVQAEGGLPGAITRGPPLPLPLGPEEGLQGEFVRNSQAFVPCSREFGASGLGDPQPSGASLASQPPAVPPPRPPCVSLLQGWAQADPIYGEGGKVGLLLEGGLAKCPENLIGCPQPSQTAPPSPAGIMPPWRFPLPVPPHLAHLPLTRPSPGARSPTRGASAPRARYISAESPWGHHPLPPRPGRTPPLPLPRRR